MCKGSNALSRPVLMVRGLDGYLICRRPTVQFSRLRRGTWSRYLSVVIARGPHLFPFRTEQLSPSAPMVLGSQGPGRVGRRRFNLGPPPGAARSRPGRVLDSPPRMSVLEIIVIVVVMLLIVFFIGGLFAVRAPRARAGGHVLRAHPRGGRGARAGAAADRGWHRDTMEALPAPPSSRRGRGGPSTTSTWCSWTTVRASRRTAPTSWRWDPTARCR